MNDHLFTDLSHILEDGFTGQIILHCNEGQVGKYEIREVRRPNGGIIPLSETASESLTEQQEPT
jgi:hypothetical protein